MALNWEAISNNIINISQVLGDFLDSKNAKQVEWIYMDEDGSVKNIKLPNLGSAIKQLQDTAITPDELSKELKNYYKSVEVDAIKAAINKTIDDHVNDLQGKINSLNKKVDSNFNTLETSISNTNKKFDKEISNVNNDLQAKVEKLRRTSIMTESENEALKETNRNKFTGSGFFGFGHYGSNLISRDMWVRNAISRRSWTYNSLIIGYPINGSHRRSDEQNSIYPKLVVNGSIFKLRNINWSDFTNGTGANIKLPEPPTSKAIVKDSGSLPVDLKQGDFIILKDLTKEFVANGSFDKNINNWEVIKYNNDYKGTATYDSDKKRIKLKVDDNGRLVRVVGKDFNIIQGVKYKLTFIVSDKSSNAEVEFKVGSNPAVRDIYWNRNMNNGIYTSEFVAAYSGKAYITLEIDGAGSYAYYDNISIKQVEETPVICKGVVKKGIDLYAVPEMFIGVDSISNDLIVIAETWKEPIKDKKVIHPFGLVQYSGPFVEEINKLKKGGFEGDDTYSLFGTWEEPGSIVGLCYHVDDLTTDELARLTANPEHKLTIKDGELYQEKIRIRVIKGLNNDAFKDKRIKAAFQYHEFASAYIMAQGSRVKPYLDYFDIYPYNKYMSQKDYATFRLPGVKQHPYYYASHITEAGAAVAGHNAPISFAIPIARIQRRNDGIYNKIYNPAGTAVAYDKANSKLLKYDEYAIDDSFIKSLEDCFKLENIAAITKDENIVTANDSAALYRSGYIDSKLSGHPDGIFADIVQAFDVEDLRLDVNDRSETEIMNKHFEDLRYGRLREPEKDYEMISFINRSVWFGGNTAASNRQPLAIYVGSGADDYIIKQNGKIIDTPENSVVHIFDNNGNFIKLIAKANGNLRRITFNHKAVSYGMPWTDGSTNRINMIIARPAGFIYNNIINITDIIGDPRKLKDRIKYNTSKDNDGQVNKNDYILHSNGKYYRALETRGNLKDIEKDIDGNSSKYIELGTDGLKGGYPNSIIERYNGRPLIVSETGSGCRPIDMYSSSANSQYATEYIKLSRKVVGPVHGDYGEVDKVVAILPNGEKRELTYNASWTRANSGKSDIYWTHNASNRIALAVSGLNKGELELCTFIITYKTKTKKLKQTSPSAMYNTSLITDMVAHTSSGDQLVFDTIEKVPTNGSNPDNFRAPLMTKQITSGRVFTDAAWTYTHTEHLPCKLGSANVAAKQFGYISEADGRMTLNIVFKELKFTSDPKYRIEGGVYLNDVFKGGRNRSYTIAYFNESGELLGIKSFDAYGNKANADAMADYINAIRKGSIVAVSTWDEPRNNVYNNDKVLAALQSIGANTNLIKNFGYRCSYALIGIKTGAATGTKLVESYRGRYDYAVRVSYEVNGNKIVADGVGDNSIKYVSGAASYGDDNQFQIKDGINYTKDRNDAAIILGHKSIDLPYIVKK